MGLSIRNNVTKKLWRPFAVLAVFALVAYPFYNLIVLRPAAAVAGVHGSVVINEFSANGDSDWAELYNTTDQQINLGDWQLFATSTDGHVSLPDGTIDAHAFAVVELGDYLHENSDTLRLLDSDSTEIDTVTYDTSGPVPYPATDQTTARIEDGGAAWAVGASTKNVTNVTDARPTLTVLRPSNYEVFGGADKRCIVVESVVSDDEGLKTYHIDMDNAQTDADSDTACRDVALTRSSELKVYAVFDSQQIVDGVHDIHISVTDTAGHTTRETRTIVIDNHAPVVTLGLTSSATPSASTPVNLEGTIDSKADLDSAILQLDGKNLAELKDTIGTDGKWQYDVKDGLSQGKHVFSVVAKDTHGNTSDGVSSPQSSVELSVGPFVPPESSIITPSLTEGLSDPFVLPGSLDDVAPPIIENGNVSSDTDVLGAKTKNDPTVDQNMKVASIAPTESGWKLFGMLWYWWLLAGALIAAMLWGLATLARHRVAENYA